MKKLFYLSFLMLLVLSINTEAININWESTTVDNNTAGAVTTYTLEAVMPNAQPSQVAAGATIIITFPTFTDATFFTSGTIDGGEGYGPQPIVPTTTTLNTITFILPVDADLLKNKTITVVLNGIRNPIAGNYTNLTMLTTPNAGGQENEFFNSDYTIVAQLPTLGWDITGNGNISAMNFIGTTSGSPFKDFIIKTDDVERVRVLGTNGYTGFGTSAPDALVDINGDLKVRKYAYIQEGVKSDTIIAEKIMYAEQLQAKEIFADTVVSEKVEAEKIEVANLFIRDNKITSPGKIVDFVDNDIFTSGNIQADTVKAQVAQFSKSSNITGTLNVQGELHLLGNAFIDSILTALSIKTNYLETENILINQISQFNGIVNIGSSLTFYPANGSIISNFLTSKNIQADTVQAQVAQFSKSTTINGTLTADTIQSSVINGSTILQNGLPLTSSQWLSLDSNIYFSTGSVFVKELWAEKAVNIGGFRFTNGAEQQKDSIRSTAEIVIASEKKIQLESDTVLIKNRLGVGVSKAEASLDVSGDAIVRGWLYVQDGVVIGKSFEGQKAIIDSIRSERAELKNIQAETVNTEEMLAKEAKVDTLTTEKAK